MEGSESQISAATYALRLGATLFFVVANGFFVAAEFALVKVRVTRLSVLADHGNRRARLAQHIAGHLDHYLSACQLGITLCSLILGWLAEPAVAQLLLTGFRALGLSVEPSAAVSHAVALVLALSVVTVLHMTVGEQAPKIWAIHRADATALYVAYPLWIFSTALRPFIWFINGISNTMLRVVGVSGGEHGEASHDVREIKGILSVSARAGHISERQLHLAENVLHLVDLRVRHILVPRVDVVVLSTQRPLEDNLRVVRESGHTRLPLCRGDLDTVVGTVHVKDLLKVLLDGRQVDLEEVAREPLFVSESQPLSRLIVLMQRETSHSAVVLDEYGSAVGMVFLEDAIEHVVGTIRDEFDEAEPLVAHNEDGSLKIPGGLALPAAVDILELGEVDDTADTIGGYVVARLGRLPEQGDQLEIGPYLATIGQVSRRRIQWLRFEPRENAAPATPPPHAID